MVRITLLLLSALLLSSLAKAADKLLPLMPKEADFTHMWWAEGFPSVVSSAPWLRCIQTGSYAFVLDTETLAVPHFGPITNGQTYAMAGSADNSAWKALPSANLTMTITVSGKTYRCTGGTPWTQFEGPRLIESGRFVQRGDVTGLNFVAADGQKLNAEARFETVAWPDRLSLILAARPGSTAIPAGAECFGRLGGGFGFDGTNHLEVPHRPELDTEKFTLELWVYVPADYKVSKRTFPWLVCKNQHEHANGNYGLIILNGIPQARMNIGGGPANAFSVNGPPNSLKIEGWNHLAMSYDGDVFKFYVNGKAVGQHKIGLPRLPGKGGLAFGRRQDNSGDGYHFRGAMDEIRLYDHVLTEPQLAGRFAHPEAPVTDLKPAAEWTFKADGKALMTKPSDQWKEAAMELHFGNQKASFNQRFEQGQDAPWTAANWHEVALAFDPVSMTTPSERDAVTVKALEIPSGTERAVTFDDHRHWHRIDLDGIVPTVPKGGVDQQNNAIERVKLVLTNNTDQEQTTRLLFDKSGPGIRQRIGSPITGLTAMLRNANGQPTGIPVQISKDWHNRPEGGVYSGTWFHGFSQVRLPAHDSAELEFTLNYGHWGGVAAASHAQLCLIGWGANQLWDQSALGSWGESICYEPDQIQGHSMITDVRPNMVRAMGNGARWGWTSNVGGGDFFRFFTPNGDWTPHSRVRTVYHSQGPCLTEVTYAGSIGEGIAHSVTTSLGRTDDVVRGTYQLRMDVSKSTAFSRFVLFQIGADTYSYTGERKMALGNESGLIREWSTKWGGNTYRTAPAECTGRVPWISLHEGEPQHDKGDAGAWANRGIVIRSWKAKLGGKPAAPGVAEHGVNARSQDTSTLDLLPPPGVTQLEPGDFVEATIEHIIVPQYAKDYYGPNEALRSALNHWQNTWHMIHREATANDRHVEMKRGKLIRLSPAITIEPVDGAAEWTLNGGLGYVPITFTLKTRMERSFWAW